MVQLLLVMASSIAQQEFAAWSMLLLEIIYHLYAHTNPAQLLHPEEHRDNALRSALQSEQMERKRRRQHEPTRHSRFGGALDECLAVSVNDDQCVGTMSLIRFYTGRYTLYTVTPIYTKSLVP
jgi:hypothetical protein